VGGGSTRLFRIEARLTLASGLLFVLTILWKDWIELVFRFDPDRHSGALELAIALAFLAITVSFGVLARRERSRLPSASAR
jgi:hypothetical protein